MKTKHKADQHWLVYHANESERANHFPFYCTPCNYGSFDKIKFSNHLDTLIHQKRFTFLTPQNLSQDHKES
jgi:hypothetical protein